MEVVMEMSMLLHQVLSGTTRCDVCDKIYYIHAFLPQHKFEAEIVRSQSAIEASFLGILSEEEMTEALINYGLWSDEEEIELKAMSSRIDALKVDMYRKYETFQSNRMKQTKKMLDKARTRQIELSNRRHSYDLYTTAGLAESEKLQYLLSKSTRDEDGGDVDVESMMEWESNILLGEYLKNKPDEASLRRLAKSGHWRTIWSSGRHENGVFGLPSSFLTDQQQSLISWSKLYDNIAEHPEPPDDEVLEDDDLLDGWIIVEREKRSKSSKERAGNKHGDGAQEVFIQAGSPEDAKRIDAMNSVEGAFVKSRRMNAMKKGKVVEEQNMPDSKQKIAIQAANEFKNRVKGK